MKRFGILIALTLIFSLLLPFSVAEAISCLNCGSTEVYFYDETTSNGPTDEYCVQIKKDRFIVCGNCDYKHDYEPDPPLSTTYHSFSAADLGCSNNVHTWKRFCTKNCGWTKIYSFPCQGPPHCYCPF